MSEAAARRADHPAHPARTSTESTARLPDAWIRGIADARTAAGPVIAVRMTRAGLDLTATAGESGQTAAELILDEAGYAELRWWIDLTAAPADVTASITQVLAPPRQCPILPAPRDDRHQSCPG